MTGPAAGGPPGADPRPETPAAPPPPSFDRRMLEVLVCPLTRGPLHWDAERQELVSRAASLAFPVRDGIPIMLESEARKLDG